MAFRSMLIWFSSLGWATAACGQRIITLTRWQLSGTIVQIGPRAIAVKAANGQNWTVKLRGDTKVKVTGTAEPEMLTPKTCVRFAAGSTSGPVRARKSSTNHDLHADAGRDGTDPWRGTGERTSAGPARPSRSQCGRAADGTAGAGGRRPEIPDEEAAGGKPPKRRGAAAKGPDKSVPNVASYDVCAEVLSYHAGRLIVSVQNRFLKPKITVNSPPSGISGSTWGTSRCRLPSPATSCPRPGFSSGRGSVNSRPPWR